MSLSFTTDKTKDKEHWKILIIDDDRFIHAIIKEALKDFTFESRGLTLLHAYTYQEALNIVAENKDIALILLDIYLDRDATGLKLTRYIREMAGNSLTRIVLMTSSLNSSLQKEAVLNYDINGYEYKNDLITKKLYTVVVASLRYYRDILHINNNRMAMERIVTSSTQLFGTESIDDFFETTLYHLNGIINLCGYNDSCNMSSLAAVKFNGDGHFKIISAFGKYKGTLYKKMEDVLPSSDYELISLVRENKNCFISEDRFVACYISSSGVEAVVFLESENGSKNHIDPEILNVFHRNVAATFENLCMNKEIEETQKEILYILGEITEARSEETGNHVQRVSKYAKILAEKYGLSKRDVMLVTLASPIHDIGKIAIPDKILLKPGKLTPSEFEIVKSHTTIGYELLKNSNRDLLKSAAIIAHQHHERYDGTGYPQGLKGEEIHIFGRIVAVADVFDALGSPRVYKKPWILNDILAYFKEERGKQFDPKLVDILFENLDEFLEIKEKFSDENIKVIGQVSDNKFES